MLHIAATADFTALLTGCAAHASPQPPAPPPSTSAPATPADSNKPCTLLSPGAVGELLGVDYLMSAQEPPQTASNGCVAPVTCADDEVRSPVAPASPATIARAPMDPAL